LTARSLLGVRRDVISAIDDTGSVRLRSVRPLPLFTSRRGRQLWLSVAVIAWSVTVAGALLDNHVTLGVGVALAGAASVAALKVLLELLN
jgi:hypothetical protein